MFCWHTGRVRDKEKPEKGFFLSKINPLTTTGNNRQLSHKHGYTAESLISPKTLRCLLLYGILHESFEVCECESHCRGWKQCVLCVWVLCWGRGILHQSLLPTPLSHTHTHTHTVYPTSVVSLSLRWLICLRTAVYRKYKGERKTVCVYERENEWKGKNTFHGLEVANATVKLANYQTAGANHYLLHSGRLRKSVCWLL